MKTENKSEAEIEIEAKTVLREVEHWATLAEEPTYLPSTVSWLVLVMVAYVGTYGVVNVEDWGDASLVAVVISTIWMFGSHLRQIDRKLKAVNEILLDLKSKVSMNISDTDDSLKTE